VGDEVGAMADFVLADEPVTIVLDEGEWAGVEATVRLPRSHVVGTYWEVRRLTRPRAEGETAEEYHDRLVALCELVARDVIVAWNVVDHAGPLPVTPEGLARADPGLFGTLLGYWGIATRQSPFVTPSPATEASGRRPRRKAKRP